MRKVRVKNWKEALTGLSIGAVVCSLPWLLRMLLLALGY